MQIKIVLFFILFVSASCTLAEDTLNYKDYSSNDKPAAIFSNKLDYSAGYSLSALEKAEKELKAAAAENPSDSSIQAELADFYLKSHRYADAFDNLAYLCSLKKKGKLDIKSVLLIRRMYAYYKKEPAENGASALNIAAMAFILDKDSFPDYLSAGLNNTKNKELINKASVLIADAGLNSEKTIELCGKILSQNPDNTELRKIKASCHLDLKQAKEAQDEYTRVLAVNPSDDEACYELYKLLKASKKYDSRKILKKLYGMNKPFKAEKAYASAAELLFKNGDFEAAEEYAAMLAEKYSRKAEGYIILAEIYDKEGKLKEAYTSLLSASSRTVSPEYAEKYNELLSKLSDTPVKEAEKLIEDGSYAQALEILDKAGPDSLYVILAQAKAHYLSGNKQKSFELLNKAMSLYSNNSDVYSTFSFIYLKEKDAETAKNYAARSLQLNPGNEAAKNLLLQINKSIYDKNFLLILDAMEAQNYTEAMRIINDTLEINSDAADLYYYKALVYIALNNYAAASASLYKCIELDSSYTDAYFYMGASFDNLGEYENAVIYYKKFIDLLKNNEKSRAERIKYAQNRILKLEKKLEEKN